MNNLIKLKKDGKVVGYLELRIRTPYGYPVLWFRNLGFLDDGREWHSGNNIQADSIHPYVTDDKNGDKVFAGDRVISQREDLICSHEGIVTYRPEFADYVIVKDGYDVNEGYGNWGCKSKDIELLKDSDNG